jgi:hypothetical protein
MGYFGSGFFGLLLILESVYGPIRNVLPVAVASSEDVYLKAVEYEGHSINDYLDILFMVFGIALLVGSIYFWFKSKG